MTLRKATGDRIIEAFSTHYEDKYGKRFHPTYPMLSSAQKISKFYLMRDIDAALDMFFRFSDGNFWTFLAKLDGLVTAAERREKDEQLFKETSKETMKQIKKIAKQKPGRAT